MSTRIQNAYWENFNYEYIFYISENRLYLTDYDGNNTYELAQNIDPAQRFFVNKKGTQIMYAQKDDGGTPKIFKATLIR